MPFPPPPQGPPQGGGPGLPSGMTPQMLLMLLMKILGQQGMGGAQGPPPQQQGPVSSTMRTGIPFQGQPGPTDYAMRSLQRDTALKALLQLIGQGRSA
jgi:hypothetical protein